MMRPFDDMYDGRSFGSSGSLSGLRDSRVGRGVEASTLPPQASMKQHAARPRPPTTTGRRGHDYEDWRDDCDFTSSSDDCFSDDDGRGPRTRCGRGEWSSTKAAISSTGGGGKGGGCLIRRAARLSIHVVLWAGASYVSFVGRSGGGGGGGWGRATATRTVYSNEVDNDEYHRLRLERPSFIDERPYVTSSYYGVTNNVQTLHQSQRQRQRGPWQHETATANAKGRGTLGNGRGRRRLTEGGDDSNAVPREARRWAIVRSFGPDDAASLSATFETWNAMVPCRVAASDLGYQGDEEEEEEGGGDAFQSNPGDERDDISGGDEHGSADATANFDRNIGSHQLHHASVDIFLLYERTYANDDGTSSSDVVRAVDDVFDAFHEQPVRTGWSKCFDNLYAVEANVLPQHVSSYDPSLQDRNRNWINGGPNRRFEAAARIVQSGEWGDYDGFYWMDDEASKDPMSSLRPIKNFWLDVLLSEMERNRPFAVLGAQNDVVIGDGHRPQAPISPLHYTNGNAIYNTSHPFMQRLMDQLGIESSPSNSPDDSVPFWLRLSQIWAEGSTGIVPALSPTMTLNEEGETVAVVPSGDAALFWMWSEAWKHTASAGEDSPFKRTPAICNYGAAHLIPRDLGTEYLIHGGTMLSPWDPTLTEITLVVAERVSDGSDEHLLSTLDDKDHPFSEVVVMLPSSVYRYVHKARDDYHEMTALPVTQQQRTSADSYAIVDLCEADVKTEWFMMIDSHYHVADHVDLMFEPSTHKPIVPFVKSTDPICREDPQCREAMDVARRFSKDFDASLRDMDVLYHTEMRNVFCEEWKETFGKKNKLENKQQGNRLLAGTAYMAYLEREGKINGMYKFTDRSLFGARDHFVKDAAEGNMRDSSSGGELAKSSGVG